MEGKYKGREGWYYFLIDLIFYISKFIVEEYNLIAKWRMQEVA